MGNVSATTFRIDRNENDNESDPYQDDGNSSYYQDADEGDMDDNDMEDDDVEEDEHAVCWHCANCQQMVHAGCERCPTCHGRRGAVRRHDSLQGDGMGDSRYSVATVETRPSPQKSPRLKRPSLVTTTAPTLDTIYADVTKKHSATPPDSSPPHDLIREPPPPPPLVVPAAVSMEAECRPPNPTAATLDNPSTTTHGKLSLPSNMTVSEEPQVAKTTMTLTVEQQKVPTKMTAAEILPVAKPHNSSVVANPAIPAGEKPTTAPATEPPVNSESPTLAVIEKEVKGINVPAPNTSATVSKTIMSLETISQSNLGSNHVAAPSKANTLESRPSKPTTAILAPALSHHNGNTVRDPFVATKAKPFSDRENNNDAAPATKEKKSAVMAAGSRENQPQTIALADPTMAKLVKPTFTSNPKPMTPLKSTRETASGTPNSQVAVTTNADPVLSKVVKAVENSQTVASSAVFVATSKPTTTPIESKVTPSAPDRKSDASANRLSKGNATLSALSSEEPRPISKTSIYHVTQTTKPLTVSNVDTSAATRSPPLAPTETVKPVSTTTSTVEIQVDKPSENGESLSITKPSAPEHNDNAALTALLSLQELPTETAKPATSTTSTADIHVKQPSATGAAPVATKVPVTSSPSKEPPISIMSSSTAEKQRKDNPTLQTSDTFNLAMLSNVSGNDATTGAVVSDKQVKIANGATTGAVVSDKTVKIATPEELAATKRAVNTDVISNETSVSEAPKSCNEKSDSATTVPSESEPKPILETSIDEQSNTKASPKVISESPFIVLIPSNGEILTTRGVADQNIAPPNGNVMVEHTSSSIISEDPFIVKISQRGVQRAATTKKEGNKRKSDNSMTSTEQSKAPRASLTKALQRVAAMDIANDAMSGEESYHPEQPAKQKSSKKLKATSLTGTEVVRNPSKRRQTMQNRTDTSSSRRGGRRMRYECDWCDCAGFTKDGEMWFLRLADEKDMDEKLLPMVTDAPVKFLCLSCVPRRGTSVVSPDGILENPEEIEKAEKYNFYLGTKVDYQIWSGEYKKEQFL